MSTQTLAIVPARGGSKGIASKALRTVAGVPMILRTLRAAEESGIADRLVVSTDCAEIAAFCELRGFEVLRRPAVLAEDDVPLSDVARHVTETVGWDGTVVLLQPTCPLLKPQTIRTVIDEYRDRDRDLDWAITAAPDPHIHWDGDRLLTARVRRQDLTGVVCESGAVQIMTAAVARGKAPERAGTVTIDPREALDIDTPDDLLLAERLCGLRTVHFVVLMGPRVGTGHFWRARSLARALGHHAVSWEWRGDPPDWARQMVPYSASPDDHADLVVFDCLTPPEREPYAARAAGSRVVVFEDEAESAAVDLTVNELLHPDDLPLAVLREEFLHLPEREHADVGTKVLVTFGGTDPARLGERCSYLLLNDGYLVRSMPRGKHLTRGMAAELRWADVVLTSQGRTVLEAAACSTPCVSIAANERENRHIRIPGVTYLGLHSTVTDGQIRQVVQTTLADRGLRVENAQAARSAVDGRGLDRLVRRIEELML